MAKLLIAAFLFFITLPSIMELTNTRLADRIPNAEYRVKSRMPKWGIQTYPTSKAKAVYHSIKNYTTEFETYFNDHLPTRAPFLDLQKLIKVDLFNVSPIPEKVVIGKEGWLFLGDFFDSIVKESFGLRTVSDDFIQTMVKNVVSSHNSLSEMGVDYYFCVAPNKHTVMADKLPIAKKGPTILDQFSQGVKGKINFVDLKQDYHLAKDKMLFNKTNTHFTDLGALVSVQSLYKAIQKNHPQLQIPQFTEYEEKVFHPQTDEQTRMLRVLGNVDRYVLVKKGPSTARIQPRELEPSNTFLGSPQNYESRFKNAGKSLKVVIFGDSFLGVMRTFMKDSFGEIVFVNENKLNLEVIKKEMPDIVIQEVVERGIDLVLPSQH